MDTATLMVFLLDNIPGFSEMLNVTFEALHKRNPHEVYVQSHFCDPTIAEPILHIVDKQIHNHDPFRSSGLYSPLDSEPNEVVLNSLSYELGAEKDSIEDNANPNEFDKNLDRLLKMKPKDLVDQHNNRTAQLRSRVFPKSAPFLVAIFESLSNVTAQTCAGALLSPIWVLTTANCIDVLEDLDVKSNKTTKNSYMVVAGAKNPFKDGTIHNVTEIYVYPENTAYNPDTTKTAKDKEKQRNNSSIVLMKLETPVVNISSVKMAQQQVLDHAKVKVWGWTSVNSSSPATAAQATSKLGVVRTCDWNSSDTNSTVLFPPLCFDMVANNVTVSNGSPVLVMEDGEQRLLSLLRDMDESLLQPLKSSAAWIDQLIYELEIMSALVDI